MKKIFRFTTIAFVIFALLLVDLPCPQLEPPRRKLLEKYGA